MESEFSALFRQAREKRGLSQYQMAELLGVDNSYISKIERGLIPSKKKVVECLDLLEINDPRERLTYLLAAGYVSYEDVEKAAEVADIANGPDVETVYSVLEELRQNTKEADKIDQEAVRMLKDAFGEDSLDQLQELARLFSRPGVDADTKKVVLEILVNAAKPMLNKLTSGPEG